MSRPQEPSGRRRSTSALVPLSRSGLPSGAVPSSVQEFSTVAMFPAWIMKADLATATDVKDYDDTKAWASKGTGAYYTESWKKGDPVILKRNPNFWKNTPAVDEVRIEYVPDDNTRVLKLQGGETDIIDFVPFSQLAALSAHAASGPAGGSGRRSRHPAPAGPGAAT